MKLLQYYNKCILASYIFLIPFCFAFIKTDQMRFTDHNNEENYVEQLYSLPRKQEKEKTKKKKTTRNNINITEIVRQIETS